MNKIKKAIEILNQGGIIIYPTDTAYGIGCRIDKTQTIERLYKLRKRPPFQAMPVLVSSIEMAKAYLKTPLSDEVYNLMKKYWPGGLTIICNCRENLVPSLVRGGGNTLGVRMPDHDIVLGIINGTGVPLLGSSANFHGGVTPFSFQQLDKNLVKTADYTVEGVCKKEDVSTVVDCTGLPFKIIRQGVIRVEND